MKGQFDASNASNFYLSRCWRCWFPPSCPSWRIFIVGMDHWFSILEYNWIILRTFFCSDYDSSIWLIWTVLGLAHYPHLYYPWFTWLSSSVLFLVYLTLTHLKYTWFTWLSSSELSCPSIRSICPPSTLLFMFPTIGGSPYCRCGSWSTLYLYIEQVHIYILSEFIY